MANNFDLLGVGDINITLLGQAASNKILTDPSSGPLHNQSRSFYLGHIDENVNWEGNYNKGDDNLLSLLTYDSNNWINFTLGSVDETNTGAPILYTVSENDTMSVREIELTLAGINNIAFNIKQNPIIRLLYMIKESTDTYGDWFECIRINKGTVKRNPQLSPLSSTTDISIYNGLSGANYNSITVEIQPFRNTDVSFGFSLDRNLDSLITSNYTMTTVQNSTFFITNSVKYENGYFYFSTNNQISWTTNTVLGPGSLGDGDRVSDVSSHFIFNPISGINLPVINCYISNMISYRVITSYNVKITCLQGGSCFIDKAYIEGFTSLALNWPKTTNSSIILENCAYGKNIRLTYPEVDPEQGGFTVMVSSLLNMKYSVSIEGYDYIDYDGTTKHSNGTLSINVYEDTNILSIVKTWREGGRDISIFINFESSASSNLQTFVAVDEPWPSPSVPLNLGWTIANLGDILQSGIAVELRSNDWRFIGNNKYTKQTTISFLEY